MCPTKKGVETCHSSWKKPASKSEMLLGKNKIKRSLKALMRTVAIDTGHLGRRWPSPQSLYTDGGRRHYEGVQLADPLQG
jgi:hypothetical protein